jgi:hypothetical protein
LPCPSHFNPSDYFNKLAKPYPDFPLFPHANGCWAKKIRAKLHYFGPWADAGAGADAALAKYLAEKDALHAGRTPRLNSEALTIKDVCNAFLNAKKALLDAGELSPQTWLDYKRATDLTPVRYGPAFRKPSADVLRRHRAQNGERMLAADEVRQLIGAAPRNSGP